jgi:hypothetical protein
MGVAYRGKRQGGLNSSSATWCPQGCQRSLPILVVRLVQAWRGW